MKGYVKSRGWLFPLNGGPHTGIEVRLPWPQPGVAASDEPLPTSITFGDGAVYLIDVVPNKTVAKFPDRAYFRYVYDSCQTAVEMERKHGWRASNYKQRIRKAIKRGRKRPSPPCSNGQHACDEWR